MNKEETIQVTVTIPKPPEGYELREHLPHDHPERRIVHGVLTLLTSLSVWRSVYDVLEGPSCRPIPGVFYAYPIKPEPVVRRMTGDDWHKLARSGKDYWVKSNHPGVFGHFKLVVISPHFDTEISFDLKTWHTPGVIDGKICGVVAIE